MKTGLLSGFIILALNVSALAATSGKELIVRFRDLQDTVEHAKMEVLSVVNLNHEAEILNAEEGVVKLSFADANEAAKAREMLSNSARILKVSPNYLYQSALKLRSHKVSVNMSSIDDGISTDIFAFPWIKPQAQSTPAPLPEVLPAPTQVVAGIDPQEANDWAIEAIHLPDYAKLKAALPPKASIIAAVIDTGVDYNHEDLGGAMWRKPGNPKEVGFDTVHNNAQPFDIVHFDVAGCLADSNCQLGIGQGAFLTNPGHGTHCAGHVGAVANNWKGIRGVGTVAQVMALKFFYNADEDKAGQGDDAAAVKAIDYAIANGAKVISASWGGRMTAADANQSELHAALIRAQRAGLIVVIAAGNDSIDQDKDPTPSYPAAYHLDNLIIVAATDKNDAIADFSNFGAKSVNIGAPGVKILSTTAGSHYDDVVTRFKDAKGNLRELDWDGTSMATPIVAGAVSLVWAKNPKENYHQIRDRILKSARKVAGLSGKTTTGGVLDVAAALGMGQ